MNPNYELALKLFVEGKTLPEVIDALYRKGMGKDAAQNIALESYKYYISVLRKKAVRKVLIGSFWLLLGLIVTIISMNSDGNRYIVAYGAVIWGGIQIIYGCIQLYITGKKNIALSIKGIDN